MGQLIKLILSLCSALLLVHSESIPVPPEDCLCNEGYEPQNSKFCRLIQTIQFCNVPMAPHCNCPDEYHGLLNEHLGNLTIQCSNHYHRIPCANAKEVDEYLVNYLEELTASPLEQMIETCQCQANMKVIKNDDYGVLCVHPSANFHVLPCDYPAPAVCKCPEGHVYTNGPDGHHFFACMDAKTNNVQDCLNQEEVDIYAKRETAEIESRAGDVNKT